jgi:hypothetical protein
MKGAQRRQLFFDKLLRHRTEHDADAAAAQSVSATAVPLGGGGGGVVAAKRKRADSDAPNRPAPTPPSTPRASAPDVVERPKKKGKGGRKPKWTEADSAELRMREAQASAYAAKYRELLQWAQLAKLLEQDTAVEVLAETAGDLARTGLY